MEEEEELAVNAMSRAHISTAVWIADQVRNDKALPWIADQVRNDKVNGRIQHNGVIPPNGVIPGLTRDPSAFAHQPRTTRKHTA